MSRHTLSQHASSRVFLLVSALLFMGSAAMTVIWDSPMSSMDDMPMPGGWSMSMTWMRMPGETWLGATVSFVGMWTIMMMTMMWPSLVPMLWRYRQAVASKVKAPLAYLSTIVGAGYFLVWAMLGVAIFPLGAALMALEMHYPVLARSAPRMIGVAVLTAGVLQFTSWKARHLACCRVGQRCCHSFAADIGAAWRHGISLGIHCIHCCAGLTAILLIVGVMDLRVMAVVMVAITAERLAPGGERVARVIGVVMIGAGMFLIARTAMA